jgi:hypothetical protein
MRVGKGQGKDCLKGYTERLSATPICDRYNCEWHIGPPNGYSITKFSSKFAPTKAIQL